MVMIVILIVNARVMQAHFVTGVCLVLSAVLLSSNWVPPVACGLSDRCVVILSAVLSCDGVCWLCRLLLVGWTPVGSRRPLVICCKGYLFTTKCIYKSQYNFTRNKMYSYAKNCTYMLLGLILRHKAYQYSTRRIYKLKSILWVTRGIYTPQGVFIRYKGYFYATTGIYTSKGVLISQYTIMV